MKRFVFLTLAFLVGCNGMGGGSRLIPGSPGSPVDNAAAAAGGSSKGFAVGAPLGPLHHGRTKVRISIRIPHRHRGHALEAHPSTISASTQSVGIAVNTASAQIFNTTPTSSGCSVGPLGTTCTFTVNAPVGPDTFTVTTYSAVGGGGAALDHGVAAVTIVAGKVNSPTVTLGPVVSTTADTGIGSLRYAVASANGGDTIMFLLATGSTITLNSPITVTTNVSVAGPGVTGSAPRAGDRRPAAFSGITISGGGSHQIFIINKGVTATISGLILASGQASIIHQPGGAVSNKGTLTLASDALTGNTSIVTNVLGARAPRPQPPKPLAHGGPARPKHIVRAASRAPHVCTTSPQYGGALYNDGTLTITGTTFDSNVVSNTCTGTNSSYGGAIYNDTDGSMFVSTSTFSNNAAEYGGAVYNDSTNGQATFTSDVFAANYGCIASNGCATTGCSVGSSCSTGANGYGAAIYDADGPGITIATSTFTGNVTGGNTPYSSGYGGAVYLEAGSPTVSGSTFTNNQAGGSPNNCGEGEGGAIYSSAGNSLELDNSTFTGNAAIGDEDAYGGAVYGSSNPVHGSGNTFTSNVVNSQGSPCELYPDAYGAALYATGGVSMSGSAFNTNAATSAYEVDGGTIYTDAPSTLSNNTFTGNTAATTSVTGEDSYIYGGVIENDDQLKLQNNTFSGTVAAAGGSYGYAIYGGVLYDRGGLYSTGNTFTGTKTSTTYPDDGYVYGGAIYVNECCSGGVVLASNGDKFTANMPTSSYEIYGGAIYADQYSVLNLTGDSFVSNVASALYVDGGAVSTQSQNAGTINNSTFTGNVAGTGTNQGWSGAVEADYYTTLKGLSITGSTFSGNSATSGGGAVGDYSSDNSGSNGVLITNSTFTGNTVTAALRGYGAGALEADGYHPTTVENSTFAGNSETPSQIGAGGGAIMNAGGGLIVMGSTFSGNSSLGSIAGTGGGAVYSQETAVFFNSTITGNSSSVDGGGLETYSNCCSAGPLVLLNATLYQNAATGSGGNIENAYETLTANSIIAGGTAGGVGPDVDNTGGAITSEDYNLIQAPIAGTPMATPVPDHDIFGSSPALSPLANNGGPTFTMADGASPGKAYIPFSGSNCGSSGPATDQRGFLRGAGGKCDIGAYEFSGMGSAAKGRFPIPNVRFHSHAVHPPLPVKPKHKPFLSHRSSIGAK